jgi:hypothetical protein
MRPVNPTLRSEYAGQCRQSQTEQCLKLQLVCFALINDLLSVSACSLLQVNDCEFFFIFLTRWTKTIIDKNNGAEPISQRDCSSISVSQSWLPRASIDGPFVSYSLDNLRFNSPADMHLFRRSSRRRSSPVAWPLCRPLN